MSFLPLGVFSEVGLSKLVVVLQVPVATTEKNGNRASQQRQPTSTAWFEARSSSPQGLG